MGITQRLPVTGVDFTTQLVRVILLWVVVTLTIAFVVNYPTLLRSV